MTEGNVHTGQAGDPTAEKDPADWVTGNEPATGAQKSYLETLTRQSGEDVEIPEDLTKADASRTIDELKST
jgi:phosphopantothenoylcysteine synthetase/decarboxylase